jgi:hypothetical protein
LNRIHARAIGRRHLLPVVLFPVTESMPETVTSNPMELFHLLFIKNAQWF